MKEGEFPGLRHATSDRPGLYTMRGCTLRATPMALHRLHAWDPTMVYSMRTLSMYRTGVDWSLRLQLDKEEQ